MNDLWTSYWILTSIWASIWFIVLFFSVADFHVYRDSYTSFGNDKALKSIRTAKISALCFVLSPLWLVIVLTVGVGWFVKGAIEMWRYDK